MKVTKTSKVSLMQKNLSGNNKSRYARNWCNPIRFSSEIYTTCTPIKISISHKRFLIQVGNSYIYQLLKGVVLDIPSTTFPLRWMTHFDIHTNNCSFLLKSGHLKEFHLLLRRHSDMQPLTTILLLCSRRLLFNTTFSIPLLKEFHLLLDTPFSLFNKTI